MLGRLRSYLIAGLIVLFPVVATYWAMTWLFNTLDRWLVPIERMLFGRSIFGLGAATGIVIMIVVGAITTNLFGRRAIGWIEEWLMRLPLVRPIYSLAKGLTDAIAGGQRRAFREVVVCEYPRPGMYTVMFVTARHGRMISLFIPTVPNPTSGWFLILPEEEVEVIAISVENGLKWAVSGGIIIPSPEVPDAAWQAIQRLEARKRGAA